MKDFVGTGALVGSIVRRDRLRIAVWVVAIVVLVFGSADGVAGIYPTRTDLVEAAAAVEDNAAAIAFNGPVQGLDTLGGRVAFETGTVGMIVAGLMSLLMVGRLTRAEEESGRIELVRAAAVGQHAPTTAALLVVTGMNLVVGVAAAGSLMLLDLPVTGSVAFGVGFFATGIVFAVIATLTAQLSENTRVGSGIAGVVLGAAFVLRAIGDIGDGTLSWLSPIGWSQKVRPYAGERWWPLLVPLAATVLAGAVAAAIAVRRDVGGGVVPPRPGPPEASVWLRSPLALAVRLQRGTLIGWGSGLFVLGLVYGSVGTDIEDFIGDNEALADILTRAGMDVTESFLATSILILALVAAGYAVQSTYRLRTEETATRAEPLLVAPVSRWQWAASHLIVAILGTAAVLLASGLGLGLSYGIAADDLGEVPRLAGAALAYLPAVVVLVGITVALFGLAPRAIAASWIPLGFALVIGMFGELLSLPRWVNDLSPFEVTPRLPADELSVTPLVILTAIAAGLCVAGVRAFRRRDLAT